MTDSYYSALTAALAHTEALSAVADNLANINTTGFKASNVQFNEVLAGNLTTSSHTIATNPVLDLSQGAVKETANPLDCALSGPGFFVVQDNNNNRYLTRQGNFHRNIQGQLEGAHGYIVQGHHGSVFLPEDLGVRIDSQGIIYVADAPIDQLQVVQPTDLTTLQRSKGGLYTSGATMTAPPHTRVQQYALEGANISPIGGMTQIIELQRAYEAYHRTFEIVRSMEQKLTNQVV